MGDFNLKGLLDMAERRLDAHNQAMDAINENYNRPSIEDLARENNRRVARNLGVSEEDAKKWF